MFAFYQEWKKNQERQRILLAFYEELKKNLESYYVMDQLGRFRLFRLTIWSRLNEEALFAWDEPLVAYIRRLEEYNALLDDFLKYEQWYASDINNKTPATARVLHDKREEPRQKFQGLEPVIKSAIQSFEKYLQEQKILKS